MVYDRLRERLAERPTPAVTTMPDGSVDRYCTVSAGGGDIDTQPAFGRAIRDGRHSSFRLAVDSVEPGGQAVNVAKQAHALEDRVTCYGHLDHPVLADLPFETVSMGAPTPVYACNFADGDVMFVEGGAATDWTLADLWAVADRSTVFGVDAVCCANWASFPGLAAAFHELGDADLPRRPFVLDPGDVVGFDADALADLRRALAALQDSLEVVYNVNRQELRATAATLPDPPADDADRAAALRADTGIDAVVMHARETAVAATREGVTRVGNLGVERPVRHTGGGDHFTGGLAHALAAGWEWPTALACGNACASHYVANGVAGGVDALRAFVRERAG